MNKTFSLHNYEDCIVNLSGSILKKFGVHPSGKTLPLADELLKKDYKNVVVLILDGLGTCILEKHLKEDGFLRRHFAATIHTVFPPTTVAATTSVISGLQPIEHAWLGWDCYYPQIDKNVTVFMNTEQGTDKPAAKENVAWKYCGYESVVDRLNRNGHKAYSVTPFVPPCPDSFEKICSQIVDLCANEERKYIYAYWTEPDHAMHEYGCYSEEAKTIVEELEQEIRRMCQKLEDTLLIVTADHGHIDGRNVSITDYPAIMECFVRMPSIEPRALNFFIKEDKKQQFENEFQREFGNDYILLTREEILEAKLFGDNEPHRNVADMVGDYVAIATTDLTIYSSRELAQFFRGTHAGYTKDELEVPLIVFDTERG